MTPTNKTMGRLAGLAYFGVVAAGMFSLAYVPSQLITMADPAATLEAISGSELLFRAGVAAGFACYVCFLILPFLLHWIFAPFGPVSAALMVGFAAVSVPISMLALSHQFAIIRLLNGEPGAMDPAGMAVTVIRHLEDYRLDISVAGLFWGLWLIPLGYLVLKSGAIPRVLGAFLVLGGLGYVLEFFGPIVFAGYRDSIVNSYDTAASSIGELGTCFWLLIMGAREMMPPAFLATQTVDGEPHGAG
ncbi:MAG: DUF4386 domain-containing protein [Alphaproteobacteria bacterium]